MSEDELERSVLRHVRWDRRSFIKKAIIGGIFVAPAVASFDMFALSGSADGVTCTVPNQQDGTAGSGTTGGTGGSRRTNSGSGACGGTPGGGTGGAAGAPSDRAIKTAITAVVWG